MTLSVDYLNHASVLLRCGDFALLTDPWFEGTAFSGGWGLSHENPGALEIAALATHLWISHWHSDHLHVPTLEKLALRNSHIEVLANVSANFSMLERLQSAGFCSLLPLHERRSVDIDGGVSIERFPTAGIDNALLVRAGGFTILNYNDCNLPAAAVQALKRRIGTIDLLLTNYNHAGKLFQPRAPAQEKDQQWAILEKIVELFEPRLALPFASSHYYRSPASWDQNESLLSFDEIEQRAARDPRIRVLRIGERMQLARSGAPQITPPAAPPKTTDKQHHDYGPSAPWDHLLEITGKHCQALRSAFPVMARYTEPLTIQVDDHARSLQLDCRTGIASSVVAGSGGAHIATHSRALFDWLGRAFGADTFVAGAHFGIIDRDTRVIERWALLTLLLASHLSERDALRYIGSRAGWWFLWCRRQEIFATLRGSKVKAGQCRLT